MDLKKYQKLKPGMKFGKLLLILFDKNKRKWLCKCDCGNETYAHGTDMKSGKHLGCKCSNYGPQINRRLPNNLGPKNEIFRRYKSRSKKKKIQFNITFDQFIKMIEQNCFYCGSEPLSKLSKNYVEYMYNTIDRIDNNKGYTYDNVVTCCHMCNFSKRENSLNEWKNWILQIYNYMSNNGMFNDQSKDVDSSESKWETSKLDDDMV